MQILLYYLLFNLAFFGDLANDPANEAFQGRSASRQFECERITQAKAHEQYPGVVPAPHPRAATFYEIDALVCDRLIVEEGRRSPRDELILRDLGHEVGALVSLAAAPETLFTATTTVAPTSSKGESESTPPKDGAASAKTSSDDDGEENVAKGLRWKVDAFYPDLVMTRKIAGAARVALAERGFAVSDLPPVFTAGDIEVFRSMHMRQAIPLACKRLYATKSLADDEVFLSLALLHEKESQLHVGTCHRGVFQWLR